MRALVWSHLTRLRRHSRKGSAALVAVVMATGLIALCSGNDSDAAGESTQPSITTTTTAGPTGGDSAENATTATPTLASGLAGWSDPIDLPPAGDTSNPQDVVVHGDQLVAVGAATFGGTTWEEVALPGVGFAEFHAVASTADGLPIVAGANAADRMAVWRQGADGAWTGRNRMDHG